MPKLSKKRSNTSRGFRGRVEPQPQQDSAGRPQITPQVAGNTRLEASQSKARQPEGTRPEVRVRLGLPPKVWRLFLRAVKLIGVASSIGTAVLLVVPKVSIEAGPNLNPQDEFSTLFAVKNEGHVPIFNVQFECAPHLEFSENDEVRGVGMARGLPTDSVWPGQTITRECLTTISHDQLGVRNVKLDATVTYKWPTSLVGRTFTQSTRFHGKHGAAGYFLVPDLD